MGVIEEKTVDCRLCGEETPMLGTGLCDSCWELETRIHGNPELARKILDTLDEASAFEEFNDGDDLICSMCNGLGEDPRTDKICTSCHGQGWKTKGGNEDD